LLIGLLAAALIAANLSVVTIATSTPAAADTAPVDPTLPETVSAAALPTVQINGVVWAQVIVGNRVYATGQFTQARPAGAAAGTNETPRSNILAYDLTTGELITSWAPTLNAQGLAIAASADGSTIYVGGDFDQVNGQWRSRIAAIDAQTGAVKAFNPGANTTVRAIAVNSTANTVYYGGFFTSVGNTDIGSTARSRLAAADATTGALRPWAPATDREVVAMVVHPASGRVIVGGNFNTVNGGKQWGSASLDGTTGAPMPWAANTVVTNHDSGSEISSLSTDGEKIYGTGWAFFAGGADANLEGAFAADPMTGVIDWVDGGRGDNYSSAVGAGVLYTVGHPHDWGMLDWNPQYPDPWQFQRSMAIDTRKSPTLTNAFGTPSEWQPFAGRAAAQPLHWLPTLTGGTYTGQGQAAWSVATNGDYVVEGGEFPRVNGKDQQGLVRFAKRAISPLTDDIQNYTELLPTLTGQGPGSVRVAWKAAWDRDNARLKVEVLRGATTATSTVLKTFTTDTTWWNRPPLGFVDTTAPAGTSQTYRIRVTDPWGNGFAGPPATITVPAGTPTASSYSTSVLSDNPSWQWRLGETSGTTATDSAGSNDLTLNSAVQRNQAGALLNDTDKAANFPGTSSTSTVQGATSYWQGGPQAFSLEAWVKTSTSSGGKIIGFGDSRTGRSSSNGNDRSIYMNNSGQLYFGVRPDMGTRTTINSPSTYRDNQWHHVVGTLGAGGMSLYVDGNLVASNANVKKAQVYRGYWRVGGDNLGSWPSAPSREAIAANVDEVAVYPAALSLGRIRSHYLASGRTTTFPNIAPVASFTSTSHYLTGTFDGSTSTDDDGSIASYAWSFGDGGTGTGVAPQHTYATAGTYTATLTVTDNRGGTNTTTRPVTVTNPPPNILPTASFTSTVGYHTASFASTSTDEDGTIASYAWSFGDGTTGIGATPQHTYATAGTYTVGLTVTDNRGGTASTTGAVTLGDLYANDAFERVVTNGLGTADNGGSWSLSGAASSFAVANGTGRITGVVNSNRSAYLAGARQTDVDVKAVLSLDSASTGGGAYVSMIGRRVSTGNDYRLKLRYLAGGTVAAYLVRTEGNVETVLASTTVPGLTVSANDQLRVRFVVGGTGPTTVRAKVWRKGAQEPTAWLLTNSSATPTVLQAAGDVGVLLYVSGTWTGAAPTVSIDDFKAGPDSGPPVNTPPTASFTANPQYLTAWLDASASTDADDGQIVSYAWTFGDGTTGTGATPHHGYAAAGTYPVTLTVTDNGGATAIATGSVTVVDAPPPTAFFVFGVDHLTASFDASGSGDVDGTITSYAWNFGDGTTGTGEAPQHTYAATGSYTVTLNVTDDTGHTGTTIGTVDVEAAPAPTASFTAGAQFLTASFDGSGSSDVDGTIAAYAWNFGDSTTGTGVTPQHTYAAAGTYTVTLTVTDNAGNTGSTTGTVTVTSAPAVYAADTFGRVVANGLGTADLGGAWTLSGAAAGFSADGSTGRILGAVAANRAAYLGAVRQADVDLKADVALDVAATGGGAYASVIGRRVSNNNDYRLKLRYVAGGAVAAYLTRTLGGVETVLGSVTVPGLTAAPGDVLRVRFQVSGTSTTTVRAKVWRANAAEPATWLLTGSEATPSVLQAAGDTGVLLYLSGSWTGTLPTLALDNFSAGAIPAP
jgi:PKD repeat protein